MPGGKAPASPPAPGGARADHPVQGGAQGGSRAQEENGAPPRARPDPAEIRRWLDEVPDPEIPVISVTDLGIVRDVAWEGDVLKVTITPTYSGCPATSVIAFEIERHLRQRGVADLRVERQLSPAWTSDWLTPRARERLEAWGIAPPESAGGPKRCPRCGGGDLERLSQFGSTPCKAQWRCRSCREPFEYFKCI